MSAQLASESWYSTHSVAYSLMALSKFIGTGELGPFRFHRDIAGQRDIVESHTPVYSETLNKFPADGAAVAVENVSNRTLFVTVANRGIPAAGNDDARSSGFSLDVSYTDANGQRVDVRKVPQGTDLIAEISIRNQTAHRIDNIALAQLVPAGWEIENERMQGDASLGTREGGTSSARDFAARAEYVDIRDDRIYRYFSLKPDESIFFRTRLNAAYRGRYYLPSISVEAMYDASKLARTQGQWIEVVPVDR
jgi:uncharacterized protein YfaS (alpha-2-macroglobulin family)